MPCEGGPSLCTKGGQLVRLAFGTTPSKSDKDKHMKDRRIQDGIDQDHVGRHTPTDEAPTPGPITRTRARKMVEAGLTRDRLLSS